MLYAGIALLFIVCLWLAMEFGVRQERIQSLEKEREGDLEAKKVKDKIDTDPEYRKNMRKKFTHE